MAVLCCWCAGSPALDALVLQNQPESGSGHIGVYRVSCLTCVADLICSGCKLREGRTENQLISWYAAGFSVHILGAAAYCVVQFHSKTLAVPPISDGAGG